MRQDKQTRLKTESAMIALFDNLEIREYLIQESITICNTYGFNTRSAKIVMAKNEIEQALKSLGYSLESVDSVALASRWFYIAWKTKQ